MLAFLLHSEGSLLSAGNYICFSIKISIQNAVRNDAGLVVVAGSPLRSMLSLLTWMVGLGLQCEP